MEYRVVAGAALEHFQSKVNEAIKEGWRPSGNLVIIPMKGMGKVEGITEYEYDRAKKDWEFVDYCYFQPMIKE